MADDFYTYAASQRLAQIEASKAQALADLAQYKAAADYENAGNAISQVASLEAEKANLVALHQQYVTSQTPPSPPEMTPEERAAKPWSKMDYGDVLELAKTSKYGKNLTWEDPHMVAGYREVMARRSRGG